MPDAARINSVITVFASNWLAVNESIPRAIIRGISRLIPLPASAIIINAVTNALYGPST